MAQNDEDDMSDDEFDFEDKVERSDGLDGDIWEAGDSILRYWDNDALIIIIGMDVSSCDHRSSHL